MLLAGFPAGPWQTNCYVIASADGAECVLVDPGKDSAGPVRDLVADHRLKPVSLLLTHGHIDHVWCVVPLAGSYSAPAYLHPRDRHLLGDPTAGVSADSRRVLEGSDYSFAEPDDVRPLSDGSTLELAGLSFRVDHTPGHTGGSVTFRLPYDDEDVAEIMLSGDLLFAGSIGRTDLPGGDHQEMLTSLRTKVLPLDDSTVVLPGHGPQTSIGHERRTNPYLAELRHPVPHPHGAR